MQGLCGTDAYADEEEAQYLVGPARRKFGKADLGKK